MTWAKFDDNFADHPKVVALSDGAFRLHVSGICYAARYLTDGVVPKDKVAGLLPEFKPTYLRELVTGGLWVPTVGGPAVYQIHDYLQWNRSRARVLDERQRKSAGGKRGAQRRWAGE